MSKLLKLLACIAVLLPASAQARQITGVILSEADSTAVAGAECKVVAVASGNMLSKTAANVDGTFSVEFVGKDAAKLEINAAGYSTAEVLIPAGGHSIKDLKIYLSDAVALEGITVTASTSTTRNGRTIVYPSASEAQASASTVELFQKLPLHGLMADPINRSVSVDGGTPMIIIDGAPSSMTDLNTINAKDIERIEYSRVTPARYADKGYSGLLQITLKHRDDGGSINLWGRSATATAFVDGQVVGTYHQGPSQFNVYYYGSWRNYQRVYDDVFQSYVGDDFRVDIEQHDRNPFNYFSNQLQLGYTYRPNSKTLFVAKIYDEIMPDHWRNIASIKDTYSGDYESHSDRRNKYNTPSLDLFFSRQFNESNRLEVQAVGTLRFEDYERHYNYYYPGQPEPQAYDVEIDNTRRSLISEIAYKHTFANSSELGAGIQNTVSHSRNKYLGTDYQPVLTENNNYAYVNYDLTIGKVNFWVATGLKLFWIKNDDNKRNFARNLTNANLSWNINDSWSMQANFNYSPSIPGLTSLTDYKQQTSPYIVENGNPDLKVSEKFNYRLSAAYSRKNFSASLFVYYNTANNPRTDEYFYQGNKMFLKQTVNYATSDHAGASLQFKISGLAGFGANIRMDVDWHHTEGATWNKYLTSFYAYGNFWWSRGPWTLSYWRKIPCKYLNGPYESKEENGDGLSVMFRPDKHWTLQCAWWYMFARGTEYPSKDYSTTAPYELDRYIKDNANMVVLTVSYTADFGSIFRSGRRSLNNADRSSSILQL